MPKGREQGGRRKGKKRLWFKGCSLRLKCKEESVTSRDVLHLKCFILGLLSILLPSLIQSMGESGQDEGQTACWPGDDEGGSKEIYQAGQNFTCGSFVWLVMTPLLSLLPPGKQYECQSTFVSTSHTCLHKRTLFQHLSGSKMGRRQSLTALAPGRDLQLHVGLLWICLAGENFLTQVKRETF